MYQNYTLKEDLGGEQTIYPGSGFSNNHIDGGNKTKWSMGYEKYSISSPGTQIIVSPVSKGNIVSCLVDITLKYMVQTNVIQMVQTGI